MDECFLSEVLSFGWIPRHPQTHGIDEPAMKVEKRGKCFGVPILSPVNKIDVVSIW